MRFVILMALVLFSLPILSTSSECQAGFTTIMIGDDDGFGGTQGPKSKAGDPFTSFSSPTIAPGVYLNESGLDATTTPPFGGKYTFNFEFKYDATTFSTISGATVTIQSGSIGRRTDGTGFGYANVTASNGSGTVNLGDFLGNSTGAAGSPAEEMVRDIIFDVSSLISSSSTGILTFSVDGSSLSNSADQFALDYASLTIQGNTVPEPASFSLLITGGLSILSFVQWQLKRNDSHNR